MSIIRAPRPQTNFYVLDKSISEDRRLSWAARGLLIFLLGKPDHWKVSIQALVNETAESARQVGKTALYAIINELLDVGYMQRKKHGTGEMDYYVHELPVVPDPQEKGAENPPSKPNPENLNQGSDPNSGNPNLENPNLGFKTLVSTDKEVRTEKGSKKGSARPPAKTPLPESFAISERVRIWAGTKGYYRLEDHFEHFVSACKARGYTYVDWDEAFMTAIRNDWAKLNRNTERPNGYSLPASAQTAEDKRRANNEEALRLLRARRAGGEVIDV